MRYHISHGGLLDGGNSRWTRKRGRFRIALPPFYFTFATITALLDTMINISIIFGLHVIIVKNVRFYFSKKIHADIQRSQKQTCVLVLVLDSSSYSLCLHKALWVILYILVAKFVWFLCFEHISLRSTSCQGGGCQGD